MLGLMGKEGSKLRCSNLSQGWNDVNKDLFLPALIVGHSPRYPVIGPVLKCIVMLPPLVRVFIFPGCLSKLALVPTLNNYSSLLLNFFFIFVKLKHNVNMKDS